MSAIARAHSCPSGSASDSDRRSLSRWALSRVRDNAHLLRDLDGAGQVYPDAHWPPQIAEALRGLIHQANLARDQGLEAIPAAVRNELITRFRDGVLVGLSATTTHGSRPGERKARLLLEVLRDREADVLRFAHDLKVPPTSNQAETATRSAESSPPPPSTAST
ncbi:MAG: IS66 family transposase [Pseudonocardiaceae bacterium]